MLILAESEDICYHIDMSVSNKNAWTSLFTHPATPRDAYRVSVRVHVDREGTDWEAKALEMPMEEALQSAATDADYWQMLGAQGKNSPDISAVILMNQEGKLLLRWRNKEPSPRDLVDYYDDTSTPLAEMHSTWKDDSSRRLVTIQAVDSKANEQQATEGITNILVFAATAIPHATNTDIVATGWQNETILNTAEMLPPELANAELHDKLDALHTAA